MRKTAKSVMSCLVKHQKKHKPKCEKLIRETKALKKELSRKGLFPWVKRHPCDLEAILVRLESLEIDPVRLAGTDGSNCRLSIGLCECEKAPNPNSMVEKIRTRAAALRVRIENVEIDFWLHSVASWLLKVGASERCLSISSDCWKRSGPGSPNVP